MLAEPSTHGLITAGRVRGTPVFNLAGQHIGHIDDLSIGKVSGQAVYALLSFGGVLGLGGRIHPLPWSVLDYDTSRDGYVIALSKEQLKDAPSYSKDELAAFGGGDQTFRDKLFKYYAPFGATPYW